jgi:MoaA/NifB/PqqE/SkfB family radical SAM enzyme
MKSFTDILLPHLVNYLDRDLVANSKKIIKTIEAFGIYKFQKGALDSIYAQLEDPSNPYCKFVQGMKTSLTPSVRKKFIGSFLLRVGLFTKGKRIKLRQKWKQQVPWAILMDPTSSCNLKCIGCWATDYAKTDSLSFELMDRIIREGKPMGTFIYIYSGGEPLMRKRDIIHLCKKHPDCYFLAFTNGTLIDEKFAEEIARVGNFAPAISIEGFEDMTDFRRGEGTYRKAIRAMDILRENKILFGYSATYHRKNTSVVASEEFLDLVQEKGCHFGWYFTYIPVGSDAQSDLIVKPEQRAYMFHRIREVRKQRPMFLMDFWNDGEFVGGCIAGGRQYLHINAKGDVEPCAFVHYSNVNIKDMSLKEALQQPIFEEYRKNQPFNHNHLRPCPCLDNPQKLRNIVNNSKAKSTQLNDLESVEALTAKCEEHACGWAPIADELQFNHSKNRSLASKIKVNGVVRPVEVHLNGNGKMSNSNGKGSAIGVKKANQVPKQSHLSDN